MARVQVRSSARRSRLRLECLDERALPSNTFVGLGAAQSFGVFEFNGGTVQFNNAEVTGDVGVGANSKISGNRTDVTGAVLLSPSARSQLGNRFTATGGVSTQDLTAAENDANAAAGYWAQVSPTLVLGAVTSSLTVNGNGFFNIVNVSSFDFQNSTLILNGNANDTFVFNVSGNFSFGHGSRVLLEGFARPDHVLFNFTSARAKVTLQDSQSVFVGTMLVPQGTVVYSDPATFTGAVVAQNASFKSGAQLDSGSIATVTSLSGTVFNRLDLTGIGGVTLHLTGVDDLGQNVDLTTTTDFQGAYTFTGLRAGTYTITEVEPVGYTSSPTLPPPGSLGGTMGFDVISDIFVQSGDAGTGYDFAEMLS